MANINKTRKNALLGAAFLMATSAIGPGFLTQTATFTQKLGASFGFVILISILLDIGAQLNIWRIISVSEMKAQDIANSVLPGAGYFLALLIVMGGLAFNIGNVGGAGLGVNLITKGSISVEQGAIMSGGIALAIFLIKEAGRAMDKLAQLLGFLMIGLTLYVVFQSNAPVTEAAVRSVFPLKLDVIAIVTLVGGTVGGYITFAGAHRLLDAGIKGKQTLPEVSRSAVSAILIASIMRVILFLAVLGVVSQGVQLDPKNPAATPFIYIVGNIGQLIFGIVIWAASITSIVGAAYTSVSFISSFSSMIERNRHWWVVAFIIISTLVLATIGRPAVVLVFVGTLNGLILPISLGLILLAAYKTSIVGDYKHPKWLTVIGVIVVVAMAILSGLTLVKYVNQLLG